MNWARLARYAGVALLLAFGLSGAFVLGRHCAQEQARPKWPTLVMNVKKHGNKSPDGRWDTDCRLYCVIPFARLIAEPEKFNGRRVQIVAFMRAGGGTIPYLYLGEAYAHDVSDGVSFSGHLFPDLIDKSRKGVWVLATGNFDSTNIGEDQVGRLTDAGADELDLTAGDPRPSIVPPVPHLVKAQSSVAAPPQIQTAPNGK